jgi:predicted MFS family arabinose efflux permease
MAVIGMSIGVAFSFSLVLGPLLNIWIGVDGIFWLTAVLAVVAVIVLYFIVPNPVHSRFHRDTAPVASQLKAVIGHSQLLRLDLGILILHMMLTATFVTLPLALRDNAGLITEHHWYVYLPVMLFSMTLMLPFVVIAEKRRRMKGIFNAAILVLILAELVFMAFNQSLAGLVIGLFIFFTAFNVLESTLPSLVAKTANPDNKGTAMGVYSSSQFIGAFLGGTIGGWMYGVAGIEAVFALCAGMALIWSLAAATMQNPRYLSSHLIRIGEVTEEQARHLVGELTSVTGVAEAVVVREDCVAYLKVDLHALDREALKAYSVEDEPIENMFEETVVSQNTAKQTN